MSSVADALSRVSSSLPRRKGGVALPVERVALRVEREGISFYRCSPGKVAIEVEVWNDSPLLSPRSGLLIEAAPFGAFLPWSPVAEVAVPPIPPGERAVVRHVASEASLPASPAPMLDRRTRLLTQRGEGEDRGAPPAVEADELASILRRIRSLRGGRDAGAGLARYDLLPVVSTYVRSWLDQRYAAQTPELLAAALRRSLSADESEAWVGNINVFVGSTPVERHTAMALRAVGGTLNRAQFFVGHSQDRYRFRLLGDAEAWSARVEGADEGDAARQEWFTVARTTGVVVAFEPPAGAEEGKLEVHVDQESSGRTAVVEFGFRVDAREGGCLTL